MLSAETYTMVLIDDVFGKLEE